MKRFIAAILLCLAAVHGANAEERKANLLMYISSSEYTHEVRLGLIPFYIVWTRTGPALEQAARNAFQGVFESVSMCEGNNGGDVIVWLQPQLTYSPPLGAFYAQVTARFFRADGKSIGVLQAAGINSAPIGAGLVEARVQVAFDRAMQSVAAQYAADAGLQAGIDHFLHQAPCAMVALVPNL